MKAFFRAGDENKMQDQGDYGSLQSPSSAASIPRYHNASNIVSRSLVGSLVELLHGMGVDNSKLPSESSRRMATISLFVIMHPEG